MLESAHSVLPKTESSDSSTSPPPPAAAKSVYAGLGWLDRLLALWILLAIVIGMVLGNFVPDIGPRLQAGKFVDVSVPIAVGLLVMMYPILCKVRFEALHEVFSRKEVWVQLGFSVLVNWIVAPLLMVRVSLRGRGRWLIVHSWGWLGRFCRTSLVCEMG